MSCQFALGDFYCAPGDGAVVGVRERPQQADAGIEHDPTGGDPGEQRDLGVPLLDREGLVVGQLVGAVIGGHDLLGGEREVDRAAVDLARQNDAVKVQTLNYRQDPLYKNQAVVGWKVRQSIRLESTDVGALGELIEFVAMVQVRPCFFFSSYHPDPATCTGFWCIPWTPAPEALQPGPQMEVER